MWIKEAKRSRRLAVHLPLLFSKGGTMKRPSLIIGLQVLLVIFFAMPAMGADIITLDTLLDEMVNRDHLARFPQPSYTCRQASSYDREATSPKKKETWFANMDWSQFIRTEENDGHKEYVMMDAEGPGAVVRFWATWHGPGGARILQRHAPYLPRRAVRNPPSKDRSPTSSTRAALDWAASVGRRFSTDELSLSRPQLVSADSLCQALQDHV